MALMRLEEVEADVVSIIGRRVKDSEKKVNPKMHLVLDLHLDEYALAEICSDLEVRYSAYGFDSDVEKIEKMKNVDDVIGSVWKYVQKY